ncbi:hypothetical protein HpBT319_03690 [Helicobacter pylori]
MKIAKALGLKQISNRILQDFLFDAKEKMQNPTTTPSQKSILANQLQKLQDLMPKPKLLQGVFYGYQQDHGFGLILSIAPTINLKTKDMKDENKT